MSVVEISSSLHLNKDYAFTLILLIYQYNNGQYSKLTSPIKQIVPRLRELPHKLQKEIKLKRKHYLHIIRGELIGLAIKIHLSFVSPD